MHKSIFVVICLIGAQVPAHSMSLDVRLQHAASDGVIVDIGYLLEQGADINCHLRWLGDTPLLIAIRRKQFEAVKYLLKMGADPNKADMDGLTALHVVCQGDTTDEQVNQSLIIDELVKFGANVYLTDNLGENALGRAVRLKNELCKVVLLKYYR